MNKFSIWLLDTWKIFFSSRGYKIEKYYDKKYSRKNDLFALKESWNSELRELFSKISPPKKIKVLDIGCNTGRLAPFVTCNYDAEYVGIDVNKEAIALCKLMGYIGAVFAHCNGKTLSFENGAFDIVILSHSIGHLKYPKQMLKEINRVLKPNGKLGVITPNKFFKLTKIPGNVFSSYQPDLTALRYYSSYGLRREIKSAGFNNIDIWTTGENGSYFKGHFFKSRLLCVADKNIKE